MTTCERCGREMPTNIAICPSCGTITATARGANTSYSPYSQGTHRDESARGEYGQGYAQQQFQDRPPMQQAYVPPQEQNFSYGPTPNAQQMYPPGVININIVNPVYAGPVPQKNSTPLIVEILLSTFGIYGIGWLMAGETTAGVVLLICSFFVYLPIFVLGVIFTLGLGFFCLGPLAIGAIILNAVLLNSALNRKAAQYNFVQPK